MDIDIGTTIGKLTLKSCIFNGGSPRVATHSDLKELEASPIDLIFTKTCTITKEDGNPEPNYYLEPNTNISINSIGVKNNGLRYFEEYVKNTSKRVIVSITGNIPEILYAVETGLDLEINLSCPNVGKPIIGYDMNTMSDLLDRVYRYADESQIIGLKMPPYLCSDKIDDVISILERYPIDYIVCSNTMGGGLIIDPETETTRIHPNGGYGGIGGIKAISLGNVRRFSLALPNISVIGCGGIRTGSDVFEYILAGASAVQVATQFVEEGVSVFQRLEGELKHILREKKYRCISDFRGKLKIRPDVRYLKFIKSRL